MPLMVACGSSSSGERLQMRGPRSIRSPDTVVFYMTLQHPGPTDVLGPLQPTRPGT